MLLEDLTDYGMLECYLCALATSKPVGVIWPLNVIKVVHEGDATPQHGCFGTWRMHIHFTEPHGIRNAPYRTTISRSVCVVHYQEVFESWVDLASREVVEYNAWISWLERSKEHANREAGVLHR